MDDPSITPATPTPPVSDAHLASTLKPTTLAVAATATVAEENLKNAADQLAMIIELRNLPAFQWFEESFITKPYRDARAKLLGPLAPDEDLSLIKSRFEGLQHVARGVLERELAHRQKIDPRDPEIARLREKLAAM